MPFRDESWSALGDAALDVVDTPPGTAAWRRGFLVTSLRQSLSSPWPRGGHSGGPPFPAAGPRRAARWPCWRRLCGSLVTVGFLLSDSRIFLSGQCTVRFGVCNLNVTGLLHKAYSQISAPWEGDCQAASTWSMVRRPASTPLCETKTPFARRVLDLEYPYRMGLFTGLSYCSRC